MKKFLISFMILLSSCTSADYKKDAKNDFEFSKDMSLDEFKSKLEQYSKSNTYPNIDN
tara:strand:+ start:71 stop:244 length:174 start_codon:yes stop_codon:yes gene_type:complete